MKSQAFIKDASQTWAQTGKKLQGEYANEKALGGILPTGIRAKSRSGTVKHGSLFNKLCRC